MYICNYVLYESTYNFSTINLLYAMKSDFSHFFLFCLTKGDSFIFEKKMEKKTID